MSFSRHGSLQYDASSSDPCRPFGRRTKIATESAVQGPGRRFAMRGNLCTFFSTYDAFISSGKCFKWFLVRLSAKSLRPAEWMKQKGMTQVSPTIASVRTIMPRANKIPKIRGEIYERKLALPREASGHGHGHSTTPHHPEPAQQGQGGAGAPSYIAWVAYACSDHCNRNTAGCALFFCSYGEPTLFFG